jgi:hypothetical protein
MNDFLVTYLDTIDERLLVYVDDRDELSDEVVGRIREYVVDLLEGAVSPAEIFEAWGDWYHLTPAFVAAYAPELEALERDASFFRCVEKSSARVLDEADRRYLEALRVRLDMYPHMRD